MKNLLIILVVLALVYFIFRYAKKVVNNITFSDPSFEGVDLLSVVNNTSFSNINLSTVINNNNTFNIPVEGLYLEVYYQGNLIGKSTSPSERFVIPAKGSIKITESVTLYLSNSIGIAAKLLANQPLEFSYVVKATIFNFIPLTYRSTFTYKK